MLELLMLYNVPLKEGGLVAYSDEYLPIHQLKGNIEIDLNMKYKHMTKVKVFFSRHIFIMLNLFC